jgi:hypothetical protein
MTVRASKSFLAGIEVVGVIFGDEVEGDCKIPVNEDALRVVVVEKLIIMTVVESPLGFD